MWPIVFIGNVIFKFLCSNPSCRENKTFMLAYCNNPLIFFLADRISGKLRI